LKDDDDDDDDDILWLGFRRTNIHKIKWVH